MVRFIPLEELVERAPPEDLRRGVPFMASICWARDSIGISFAIPDSMEKSDLSVSPDLSGFVSALPSSFGAGCGSLFAMGRNV